METIVEFIDQVLMNPEDEKGIAEVRKKVNELMKSRPLFNG
jgi:glycine hydroxymethyltransferase